MAFQKPGRGRGRSFSGKKKSDQTRSERTSSGDERFVRGARRGSSGSKTNVRKREDTREGSRNDSFKGTHHRFDDRPNNRKKNFGDRNSGFERRSDRPKEDRRRSAYYGKPYGKPENRRRSTTEPGEKKSFVQSRLARQRKFIKESTSESEKPTSDEIRLNRFISNSGVCSRREADKLIGMGLVTVNGQTITEMGYKVKRTDDVRYEGRKLSAERPVYILLNKPKGFITTTEDPQERNTVMNLIAGACKERVYPVGRLDRNTTGLLLFTNDGELAEKLTHPSYNVRKIYKVDLDRPLTKADFQKIKDGLYLEEGKAIVDDLAIVDDSGKTVGIELHIGWNRIVRRIFEALSYQVIKLDRVVYAGLDKKDLPRGKWRFLKDTEVIKLKHFNKK